jgi:L-asparaginase
MSDTRSVDTQNLQNNRIGVVEWPGQLDLTYTNDPGFSATRSRVLPLLLQCGVDGKRLLPIAFQPTTAATTSTQSTGVHINQLGELWQILEKCLATRLIFPMDVAVHSEATAMLKILHHHALARHTIVTCSEVYPLQHQLSPAAFTFGATLAYVRLIHQQGIFALTRETLNQQYSLQKHALQFLTLGGTIDKDPLLPAPHVGASVITHILKAAQFTAPWQLTEMCRKDSNDINSLDLETTLIALKDHCEQFTSPLILTCGTDRMADIARSLQPQLKNLQQAIIFTGAITPYWIKNPKLEDAIFNIGFAMQAALLLKPGIYIAMHGEVFTLDHVHKDQQLQKFVAY